MYKEVAKRIIASILVFCMVGTIPDYSLFARDITDTGAGHTYENASSGEVFYQEVTNGDWIANAFSVQANSDSNMNAQVLRSVSFALDAALLNGDVTYYVESAKYDINVFKYSGSPLDAINGGDAPDATVTGTYRADQTSGDYFTVDFTDPANLVTYKGGETFLTLGEGEQFVVQVIITNAVIASSSGGIASPDPGNNGGIASPDPGNFRVKTIVDNDASSYINGSFLNGKTVCIKATTEEAAITYPVTGISFTGDVYSIKAGDSTTLGVEYQPVYTSQKGLNWTSNHPEIATVDANGKVTAVSYGTAEIKATSADNPAISTSRTITVCKNIANVQEIVIGEQTFTGRPIVPTFTVKDTDGTIVTDYTVVPGENKNVGTGTLKIVGNGNQYLGEKDITFKIVPANMGSGSVKAVIKPGTPAYVYDGVNPVTPPASEMNVTYNGIDLVEGTDFTITDYKNNTRAGNDAYAVLTAVQGRNYKGTINCYFSIKKPISSDSIRVTLNPSTPSRYTGSTIKPTVTVRDADSVDSLKIDRDYKVIWPADTINAGEKTITIVGVGAYEDFEADGVTPVKKEVKYTINPCSIRSITKSQLPNQVEGSPDVEGLVLSYNGKTLESPRDYTATRVDNGDHTTTITIEGHGNYTDTIVETVPTGIDIRGAQIVLKNGNPTYTGSPLKPEIDLYLNGSILNNPNEENYKIIHGNNTNAKNASDPDKAPYIKVVGQGIYAGEVIKKFTIEQRDLATLDDSAFSYKEVVTYVKSDPAVGVESPLTITYDNKVLTNRIDYEVVYTGHMGATTESPPAQMEITGKPGSNYKGTVTLYYQIEKKNIKDTEDPLVFSEVGQYVYTGNQIKPSMSIFQNGVPLVENTDYKIELGTNVEVTNDDTVRAYIRIRGIGNYNDVSTIYFDIIPFNMAQVEVGGMADQDYSGLAIEPFKGALAPVVKIPSSGKVLVYDTDFEVTYTKNIEAGTATATLWAKGSNYWNKNEVTFRIVKDIHLEENNSIFVGDIKPQKYTGENIEIVPTVTDKMLSLVNSPYPLSRPADFKAEWLYNKEVGDSATVIITGQGCYKGEIRKTFKIYAASIKEAQISIDQSNLTFTGSDVEPPVTVSYQGSPLVKGIDYKVDYIDCVNVTDASKVIITGKTNFGESDEFDFKVKPKDIEGFEINIATIPPVDYNGETVKPTLNITDNSRDRTTGKALASGGTGGYPLEVGRDYKVKLSPDNTTTGNCKLTITGMGNYEGGPIEKDYVVNKATLTTANTRVTLGTTSYTYTGSVITPFPKVEYTVGGVTKELEFGSDYDVKPVGAATNVGSVTYSIEGKNNYQGTVPNAGTYTITPKDLRDRDIIVEEIPNQGYTGAPVQPKVKVTYNGKTLEEGRGKDYTLSWDNNTIANGASDPRPSVTIHGEGNYKETKKVEFDIRKNIYQADGGSQVTGIASSYTFTSQGITMPEIVLTVDGTRLKLGEDYGVFYKNNVKSASGSDFNVENRPTVILQGKGAYGGTITQYFTIKPVNMTNNPNITYSVSNEEFTGSVVTPEVVITYRPPNTSIVYTLKNKSTEADFDYSVIAGGNSINVGEGSVSIYPRGSSGNFFIDNIYTVQKFQILPRDITDNSDITIAKILDQTFTGGVVEPSLTVKDMKRSVSGSAQATNPTCYTMKAGNPSTGDYFVEYTANDKPGEATAIVRGRGNYTGKAEKNFIIKGIFNNADVSVEDVTYTGSEVYPDFTVTYDNGSITLKPGIDFDFKYFNNKNCYDRSYILLTGKNSYEGSSKEVPFTIDPKDINSVELKNILGSYTYTGGEIKPEPILLHGRIPLDYGRDYTCTYDLDTISIGRHNMTIKATDNGNYTGRIDKSYEIGSNFNVTATLEKYSYVYERGEIEPTVTVKNSAGTPLTFDQDYGVEYVHNENVGTATARIYGKGAYKGDISVNFQITPKNLQDADVMMASVDAVTYTGEPIIPEPIVVWKNKELNTETEDFVYVYSQNTNAGDKTAKVQIVPAEGSNYTGDKSVTFTINRKDISLLDSGITVKDIPEQKYSKTTPPTPLPEVVWEAKNKTLKLQDDYTLEYSGNDVCGTATVTVHGNKNYKGFIPKEFEVVAVPISSMSVEYQKVWTYTGEDIQPPVEVSYFDSNNNKVILETDEYEVGYDNNKNAKGIDKAVITISGKGVYEDEDALKKYFTIEPRSLKDTASVTMAEILSQILKDGKAEPTPSIIFDNGKKKYKLVGGAEGDYDVSYTSNTTAGQRGIITVKGKGNFKDELIDDFYIGDDILQYIVDVKFEDEVDWVYNGQPHMPEVIVDSGSKGLTEGTDYEVIYDEDCISAGEHAVTINGMEPYGGSTELKYTIAKRDISNAEFKIPNYTHNGSPIRPLVVGVDTGALTVLGEVGSKEAEDGEIDQPGLTTNLDAFTAEIPNNQEVSNEVTVNIKATDDSNYKGTTVSKFKILPQDILGSDVNISMKYEAVYTGNAIKPQIVITDARRNPDGTAKNPINRSLDYTLVEGRDYTVSCLENIYPGNATVTITGKGHYTNYTTKMLKITADLSNAAIAPIPNQSYTGGYITPPVTVTLGGRVLRENFDYTVVGGYANNVNRGTASVTVTATGGFYTGTKTTTFQINGGLNEATLTMVGDSFTYTGAPVAPAVAVSYANQVLVYGQDYTVVYNNNVNVGTATLTVVGMGTFNGNVSKNFTIIPKSIIRCGFTEAASKMYTGSPTAQSFQVVDGSNPLVENQDYMVRYLNNTNPGTATISINGTGNYSGTKTIRYNIDVPNMPSISAKPSYNSIKVSWAPVGGVTGYEIYDSKNKLITKVSGTSYTKKKLTSMKSYTYKVRPYVVSDGATYYGGFSNTLNITTLPNTPSVKVSAGSKSVKVTWKKIKSVSGYEVYSSTSKKGKYKRIKTITKSSTVSYTNTKLKSKKTYYYKVRAYKTIKGKKIYSNYSSIKSTKAK